MTGDSVGSNEPECDEKLRRPCRNYFLIIVLFLTICIIRQFILLYDVAVAFRGIRRFSQYANER